MTAKWKCAVIGAGIIGAAAAYALARRGAEVHLFEQFELFHHRGSSHGPTRLFRTAYFEHPDYVPLARRSSALWRALETASMQTLYHQTGIVMAGAAQSELISGTQKAARAHGLALESISIASCTARFPWLTLDSDMEVLIERDAGFVRADFALAAFIEQARKFGAFVHENSPVQFWEEQHDQVFVQCNDERLFFDRLVITPGAFASTLLAGIGAAVQPMRKTLFWTAPGEPRFHVQNGFLPFAIEQSDGDFFYGFPAIDGDGVKLGEHTGGTPVATPSDDPAEARASDRKAVSAFMKRHAPGLGGDLTNEQSCLYEMSPDGHFMIDMHPANPRVSFAAGLSGHGFKFAPAIGEALADLATLGETRPEFSFLGLARFNNATPDSD